MQACATEIPGVEANETSYELSLGATKPLEQYQRTGLIKQNTLYLLDLRTH